MRRYVLLFAFTVFVLMVVLSMFGRLPAAEGPQQAHVVVIDEGRGVCHE
jgi:L-lactate utilization protein LutB